jgi:hypothetical protein
MCQRVWEPQAGGLAGRVSHVTRAEPNQALHLTASSVRSCVAPTSGRRWAPALDPSSHHAFVT